MCNFFSLITDPQAQKIMYCNWEDRKLFMKGELDIESPDSHSSIAKLFGYKGESEDRLNKYEYNPIIQKFTIDQINNEIDDSAEIEEYCKKLDFRKVIEPLISKPIVNPFKDITPPTTITQEHIQLLKQWASVRASVRDSVGDNVWASVGDNVGASVGDSVGASVRDSVGASVGDNVWASVGDNVWAYMGSFFNIESTVKLKPVIDLWMIGLVPSFDGKKWQLHGGEKAKILWEGVIE